jgi:hypothetical protein
MTARGFLVLVLAGSLAGYGLAYLFDVLAR